MIYELKRTSPFTIWRPIRTKEERQFILLRAYSPPYLSISRKFPFDKYCYTSNGLLLTGHDYDVYTYCMSIIKK